ILRHALGALIGAFQQRNVRAFGINLGALQVGAGAVQAGARSLQLRADLIAIFGVELFHDAAGLGLYLDLGDRLDLAGRHHALRQISPIDLGQLRGVDLGSASGRNHHAGNNQSHDSDCYRTPDDDSLAPLFPAIVIAVAFHDRLLLAFKSENWHSPVVTGETPE